jgi:hypothetical protein
MHRSSIYDAIKMLMLDDLIVSSCKMASGRVGMMFELNPSAIFWILVRHMSCARIQIRRDSTPPCRTPFFGMRLSDRPYAVRAHSFLF